MPIRTAIILYAISLLLTLTGFYLDCDTPYGSGFGTGIEVALMSMLILAFVIGIYEGAIALGKLFRSISRK